MRGRANNWGSFNQTTTVNPAVLEGWGTRNRDWQYGVSVQQEIAPQIAVEVSYNRRVWSNFFVTHNRALTAADYDEVTLIAPSNPALPNGGGYPVTFLTRNTRSALGATDSYYTTTDDYGDETHYWHGVDLSFNARTGWGLVVQGGTSTGRGVNDTCDSYTGRFGRPMSPTLGTAAVPVILQGIVDGQTACNATEPWLTSVRGLGSYTVPKVDVLVSAIFRSQANAQPGAAVGTNGASRTATYRLTAAQFLAATGRPLAPGLATQDVDLLLPGAGVRRPHQRGGHALREGPAVRQDENQRGSGSVQPVQRQHADDVRDGVRPGDERGAMDATDGRAAAAIHAVQRAVRLLIRASLVLCSWSLVRPVVQGPGPQRD